MSDRVGLIRALNPILGLVSDGFCQACPRLAIYRKVRKNSLSAQFSVERYIVLIISKSFSSSSRSHHQAVLIIKPSPSSSRSHHQAVLIIKPCSPSSSAHHQAVLTTKQCSSSSSAHHQAVLIIKQCSSSSHTIKRP